MYDEQICGKEYKVIDQEDLNELLDKHEKWLNNEEDGVRFSHLRLWGEDLDFGARNLDKISLLDCHFSGSYFTECSIRNAEMIDCDLPFSDFSFSILDYTVFKQSNLIEALFIDTSMVGSSLQQATTTNAQFQGADMSGMDMSWCNLFLSCNSLETIRDKRFIDQLLVHVVDAICRLPDGPEEYINILPDTINFAKRFRPDDKSLMVTLSQFERMYVTSSAITE